MVPIVQGAERRSVATRHGGDERGVAGRGAVDLDVLSTHDPGHRSRGTVLT